MVSVPPDSKKCKVELRDNTPQTLGKPSVILEETRIKEKNNEGVLPLQLEGD